MNPNEPAFPQGPINKFDNAGLTVRAYIAAKALQGILASLVDYTDDDSIEVAVKQSARVADALIAELNK